MSLNYIVIHKLSDLKAVLDSSVLITRSMSLKDEEIAKNTWCLSFVDNVLKSLSKEQFEEFVITLIDKKKKQIAQIHDSLPVTFYMWFDEMAAQIRFNILSGHNIQLPFGCRVEVVDSIETIWKELKTSHYQDGISWSELEFFEDDSDDDEEIYVLKVYVKSI